jgi:hypothetical protein
VQQFQSEGALVDLGSGDNGGNENGDKSPEGNNDVDGENGDNGEGQEQPAEEVQVDSQNNPLSPMSSGYSSVAGVPSEIKERNKQAIIIRAQIYELVKRVEELNNEKLMAQGKEELDPLIEESTLKEQEIQNAERSLEKLKKRAEKRYQAGAYFLYNCRSSILRPYIAVESTGIHSVGKPPLTLNFENSSPEIAATKVEDVLGLLFSPERKSFKLEMSMAKGGPGKSIKDAIKKVLDE